MDIREVIQETVNRHPQRIVLFNQIKTIRSIANDTERVSVAIELGHCWFVLGMHSNDPHRWNSCMNAMECIGCACWEIHDKNGALEIARSLAASLFWNGNWDFAEEIRLQVN